MYFGQYRIYGSHLFTSWYSFKHTPKGGKNWPDVTNYNTVLSSKCAGVSSEEADSGHAMPRLGRLEGDTNS